MLLFYINNLSARSVSQVKAAQVGNEKQFDIQRKKIWNFIIFTKNYKLNNNVNNDNDKIKKKKNNYYYYKKLANNNSQHKFQ